MFNSFNSFFNIKKNNLIYCDGPVDYQLGFQDPASPIAEGIANFHHDLMFFVWLISIAVMWIIARCLQSYNADVNRTSVKVYHGTVLEIVWTIVPALILVVIAIPSFALLYATDELTEPLVTIKIIGHQWYWSYEYAGDWNIDGINEDEVPGLPNKQIVNFDSYMIPEEDLDGQKVFRLLETDNHLVLPIRSHIRLLITADDVLHCWTVPSFGVKVDACPGRLNQANLYIKREGMYYGQCSEICGINHGFMPIVVEGKRIGDFNTWLLDNTNASEE